jgi:hypothetical protein
MAETTTSITPGFDRDKTVQDIFGLQTPYLQKIETAEKKVIEEDANLLRATEAQTRNLAKERTAVEQRASEAQTTATSEYKRQKEAEPIPAFVPTRDSAEDLAKLFSFIGVAGTIVSRGAGKQAAMGAMSAMTGMMEGWQKGRMDLYNQEKTKFDKDFARVQKIHQDLAKELDIAVKTIATNRELGIRIAEEAALSAGSDVLLAKINKGEFIGARDMAVRTADAFKESVKQSLAREDKFITAKAQVDAAQAKASAAKPPKPDIWQMPDGTFIDANKFPDGIPPKGARKPAAVEAGQRSQARLSATDEARERKAAELSPPERKEYRGLKNLSDEIQLLADTFKPEYANFVFDKAGDITARYQARIANDPGMAEWWRRYENVALPERHSMFGATLAGNEKDSWRKSSIGAGNSTEEILSWIADKERVMDRKINLLLEPPPARPVKRPTSVAAPSAKPQGSGTKEDPIKLD